MASSFIPSSKPANGRNSTLWLNRSKQRSNRSNYPIFSTFGRNAQRSTLNAQRPINIVRVGRWKLEVGSWAFSNALGRVKGAWWLSRSSKPSSVGNGRGRFDSYPLRHCIFDVRCSRLEVTLLAHQTSNLIPQTSRKGVTDAARANS